MGGWVFVWNWDLGGFDGRRGFDVIKIGRRCLDEERWVVLRISRAMKRNESKWERERMDAYQNEREWLWSLE